MVGTQAPRSGGRKWWQWGKAHAVVATAVAVALVVSTASESVTADMEGGRGSLLRAALASVGVLP